MITEGTYPFDLKENVVPGSDGAGIVLEIGKHVTRFKPGDKVVTIINQGHLAGSMTARAVKTVLGGSLDGTLRTLGAFDEQGLVMVPEGLSFIQAATLSCAGLTAWNASFGLAGRPFSAGQWLLTQGTGGVSLFALQFAKAVGGKVITTTSSDEKAELLTRLGADHVINYRTTADWGKVAKSMAGEDVDMVVEVGGPATLAQSVGSVGLDGIISVVGSVGGTGGSESLPTILNCWTGLFTARGVWVGSRVQMEDMCKAIAANADRLQPVVDEKIFSLEQVKEAYAYLASGKHIGKVCIQVA